MYEAILILGGAVLGAFFGALWNGRLFARRMRFMTRELESMREEIDNVYNQKC